MKKLQELYETYKVYLTRKNIELLAVTVIVLSAISVFTASIPSHGTLKLDKGRIIYKGTLVRSKMNGKGVLTFENGDKYDGNFRNGTFDGQGTFTAASGWKYEGNFSNGQADGKGKLTTESNVVYEGTFKQGIYQNAH
ncbi:MORN repeat-containing protein [Streptococcus massiliensis]|uniref:MORN repeat protein n=1 Tax=Streptococcus massiliensis TaxID=313439 RepID=A0A380KZ90_9STRE|nr:MORN repeat-containing protein [Streptococcus massiliensis]SUN77058.1 MORN repeat protein [Streptococcus massiliensis]